VAVGAPVIDGEARVVEDAEIAPDGAHSAAQLPGCRLDRHAGRPVEQVEEPPLPAS
jgi:hypothetical protein